MTTDKQSFLENKFINLTKISESFNSNNGLGDSVNHTYYDQIKQLRPYKDIQNPNNTWKNVINLAIEALNNSKDFNVSCWLLEALTYEENLYGFYLGIDIICILLNKFPECYPIDNEDKIMGFEWINNYFYEWLVNEEILPNMKFAVLHTDLLNGRFNRDLVKKLGNKNHYIQNKLDLIEKINNLISNMETYIIYIPNIINFFKKLKNFYENYMKEYALSEEQNNPNNDNPKKNHNFEKKDLLLEINKLILYGIEIDSQDIVLYLMHQIYLLKNKPISEVLKILQTNEISKLLNN